MIFGVLFLFSIADAISYFKNTKLNVARREKIDLEREITDRRKAKHDSLVSAAYKREDMPISSYDINSHEDVRNMTMHTIAPSNSSRRDDIWSWEVDVRDAEWSKPLLKPSLWQVIDIFITFKHIFLKFVCLHNFALDFSFGY